MTLLEPLAVAPATILDGVGLRVRALATVLARRLAAGATARATARDLRSLSDHDLRDIGIERDQLRAVARHAALSLHGLR